MISISVNSKDQNTEKYSDETKTGDHVPAGAAGRPATY